MVGPQSYIKEIVMDRRRFLKLGTGYLAIGINSTASALLNYTPYNSQVAQQCQAGINSRLDYVNVSSVRANTQGKA